MAESYLGRAPRFVLISTGRAGSKFTAELLTQLGIPCAHEGFFRPTGFTKRLAYLGDSSWLATPYLEAGLVGQVGPVIHQVRHPLEVVSSLYGIGFFSADAANPYQQFARRHFQTTGDELRDCVRWWTEWNRRCERLATMTFRVEDMTGALPALLRVLGYKPHERLCSEALAKLISAKLNTRSRRNVHLADLPGGSDKHELLALARRYGYSL